MNLLLKTTVLALILICPISVFAQKQDDISVTSFSKAPYKIGEKLTYSIAFSSFADAAYAELFVAGKGTYFNRDGIELRANVQTGGQIIVLYSINNDYASYIDPENGKPYRTQTVARAGANPEDVSRDYNQPAGDPAMPSRSNTIIGDYDFLSALYRLRALPLTQGSVYRFTARNNETQYDVELQIKGKKIIKTKVGSFNTIVTHLRISKNKDADKYNIKIYFGDDERHVPVLITAQLWAGEIRAELASSELPAETKPQTSNTKEPVANKTPQPVSTPPPPSITTPSPNPANPTINSNQQLPPEFNTTPVTVDPNTVNSASGNTTVGPLSVNNRTRNSPTSTNPTINTANAVQPKPFPKDVPFTANEQLNFNIFWQDGQKSVGRVSLQVSDRNIFNGNDGLMLTAKADSVANAIAKLFNINDTFTSYVNPESLLPYRSEIKQSNGNRFNQTLSIDQDRGTINTAKELVIVPVGTRDLLSLAYGLRLFDLSPGKKTPVSVFAGKQAFILTVTSVRREVIELSGQSIKAVQLQITVDDPNANSGTNNTMSDKYAIRLWVSDDKRRLPLRFSVKLSEGTLRADLAITSIKQ